MELSGVLGSQTTLVAQRTALQSRREAQMQQIFVLTTILAMLPPQVLFAKRLWLLKTSLILEVIVSSLQYIKNILIIILADSLKISETV